MASKYNISKASDMRRLERDLKKAVINEAMNQIENQEFSAKCPQCGREIHIHTGRNFCSFCGAEFIYRLEF